jgi:hypothetical protein
LSTALKARAGWLRLPLEALVIGCAILAALAADRWWQGRNAADDARTAIDGVRGEAVANLSALGAESEGHLVSERAAVQLIRVIDGDVPLSAVPIDSLIWATFLYSSSLVTRTEAMDALMSHAAAFADLDPGVRIGVGGWRAAHARVSSAEAGAEHDLRTLWRPYLVRYALARPAERINEFFRDIGPGGRAYDFVRLIEDPEFESLVLLRIEHERRVLAAHADLRKQTQALLEVLGEAGGGR